MQKLPNEYTQANFSIKLRSSVVPCPFHSFQSHTSCTSCWGKKKPAMKYGCGEKAAGFLLWMSSMLGLENMPYCCAAKSKAKESGATMRAVELAEPMVAAVVFVLWENDVDSGEADMVGGATFLGQLLVHK